MGTTSSKKTVSRTTSAPARARRTTGNQSDTPAQNDDQIAALAYRYFEESGYQHGHDLEHWLRAEAELTAR